MRNLLWHPDAWNDYLYWHKTEPLVFKKINKLVKDTLRDPFRGLGKPEPLKGEFAGCWSRRITNEHRLVYTVEDDKLIIRQCRFHY